MKLQAAHLVDAQRLWARHMHMAKFGATSRGGVDRQALSAEDIQAQKVLLGWGSELGLVPATDAAGNLFPDWKRTRGRARDDGLSHGQSAHRWQV